jgi:hypothetical protein
MKITIRYISLSLTLIQTSRIMFVTFLCQSDRITVTTTKIQVQCHMKSGILSPVNVCYWMIFNVTCFLFLLVSLGVCAMCAAISAAFYKTLDHLCSPIWIHIGNSVTTVLMWNYLIMVLVVVTIILSLWHIVIHNRMHILKIVPFLSLNGNRETIFIEQSDS